MTPEDQAAQIKTRWGTAPTRWPQIGNLIVQAPVDVAFLCEQLEQAWVANRAVQERLQQVERENRRLKVALGQEFDVVVPEAVTERVALTEGKD